MERTSLWEEILDVINREQDKADELQNPGIGDGKNPTPTPATPTQDGQPAEVWYSTRQPGDYVISGPTGTNKGRGRRFATAENALVWARVHFGPDRVRLVPESLNPGVKRWAVLVKKPR